MIRKSFFVKGLVQGVGFRPFVYKNALLFNLSGFVKNSINGVEIEVQGYFKDIDSFEKKLKSNPPKLSKIDFIDIKDIDTLIDENRFQIIKSDRSVKNITTLVSPDISVCDECLNDLKGSRFENYFAINCTQCGPRYSIIKSLPYDRCNTSMSDFRLCNRCESDYNNPSDRRYHAQPIACNKCGPKLNNSIKKISKYIKDAKIVAIKGMGGFHLVCDATNDDVIKKLRIFKNRPNKPFAIMCKDIKQIKTLASLNKKEMQLLTSKESPILLLNKKGDKLSRYVAPKVDMIGCMLPYTPLQHLLFEHLDIPIVATSANISGEPIITTKEELEQKLVYVKYILDYDRGIVNGVDDSVVQVIDNDIQILRLSRGYAPKVIKLPFKTDKKILALGANQKSTIAIAFDDNIILSPFIGDLETLASIEFFEKTIQTFKTFYNLDIDLILHDKHPEYESTKWANKQNKQLFALSHHLAHIYACKAEYSLLGDYIGFCFDGTGYGDDGTIWGGEVFVGDERKYHFKHIKLLGSDIAIKEPRRVALSILFDRYSLDEVLTLNMASVLSFTPMQIKLLHKSYINDINAPLTSSLGRLFDAVASFANLLQVQTYEGEAGLLSQSVYDSNIKECFDFEITDGVIDIKFDFFDAEIVSKFINTVVNIVIYISKKEELEVILSGGVFQNKTLLTLLINRFEDEGIRYYYQKQTPINDSGIALGQIYYFLGQLNSL